jgi:hypothetical protein
MKKLYVLLAAMLIASVSFAQVTTQKVVKKDGMTINIKSMPSKATTHQRTANSFWFNLIDDAISYYGEEAEGFAPPIQCDTLGLYPFTDGNKPVQFCSIGQVYDWSHSCWGDMYNYTGAPENVPYMPDATSYSVDSIQLIYQYTRGTNVAASVVDTLAIAYVIGLGEDDVRYLGSYDEQGNFQAAFSMPLIPFGHTTYLPTTTPATTTGLTNSLDESTIIYDKIPLTADDETIGSDGDATFFVLSVPTPSGLENLSQKQLVVIATFIPGCDRTPASMIGTDLSEFRTALYDDPREGYSDYYTEEVLNDYQVGLFHDADNFVSGSWYNIYQPNMFWEGNPKPWISLLVTCNDCGIVNVPEIEKNNITVYPNPATNNFTVNLGNDEKANIQLFNIVGQQVYSENITGSAQVNVANLHSGVYMLKINQNGKSYTTKVVVK